MAKKEPEPIQLFFKIGLRANGDVSQVTVKQNTNEITLTREQAVSLARELKRRYDIG